MYPWYYNIAAGCPDSGWVTYRNHCYRLVCDSVAKPNAYRARSYCLNMVPGADLASVKDAEENSFLHGEMVRQGSSMCGNLGFWIGLFAPNIFGRFQHYRQHTHTTHVLNFLSLM